MSKARDLANSADVFDTVSTTELGYLDGVSSAIQTQIDGKQAVVSGVDSTEIGYLDGVTSAIQTQIDSKSSTSHNHDSTYVANSLVDAKGDLLVGSADNTVSRLAVGTNGYYLQADSAEVSGVKWSAVSTGGMTLIASATPTGVGTYTFSSIPSTYKHLLLLVENLSAASEISTRIRINSDTSGNYYLGYIRSVTSTLTGSAQNLGQSSINLGILGAQNADAWRRSQVSLWFWDYAGSQPTKTLTGTSWGNGYQTAPDQSAVAFNFGGWNNSTAINAITVYDANGPYNFVNGTLKLYGVS